MKTVKQIISEALGEASVLFMSQEIKGTEIVMPTEELSKIVDKNAKDIDNLLESAWGIICNVNQGDWTKQNKEWQEAVVNFRTEYLGEIKQDNHPNIKGQL